MPIRAARNALASKGPFIMGTAVVALDKMASVESVGGQTL